MGTGTPVTTKLLRLRVGKTYKNHILRICVITRNFKIPERSVKELQPQPVQMSVNFFRFFFFTIGEVLSHNTHNGMVVTIAEPAIAFTVFFDLVFHLYLFLVKKPGCRSRWASFFVYCPRCQTSLRFVNSPRVLSRYLRILSIKGCSRNRNRTCTFGFHR